MVVEVHEKVAFLNVLHEFRRAGLAGLAGLVSFYF